MAVDLRRAQTSRTGVYATALIIPTLVFAFLATAIATDTRSVLRLDRRVADDAYDLTRSHALVEHLSTALAYAFRTEPVAALLLVVAIVALVRREVRVAIWVVASGVAVVEGNVLLKLLFERERPVVPEPFMELGSSSFPSGHSSAAALVATVLVLLTIVTTGRGLRRRLLITLWVVIGLAVAASRVLLGVHYLSDVVAGACLGVVVTVGLWLLITRADPRLPSELAVLTGTGRREVAVVLNPAKVGDVDAFKARVLQVALQEGWNEPLWYETTIEDPGHGQAQQALESGVDLIVAAGGDGTVRAVCEEAARTGVAVGIVPHGTGNLLARNLRIPLNARDALEVAFGGQDRAMDLATYSTDSGVDTSFLVMAGLGMDAAIMTGVDDRLKNKVGWLAYFVSGVKAARFPAVKVQISIDGGEFRRFRARTVVVGNVGQLQGGIPLLPDAELDDGLLDVVVLAPKRLIGWLSIIVRVLGRRRATNERLDRLKGSTVVIRTDKPMPMQLDGDPVGEGREIRADVQPGVLLVRVPVRPVAPPS